MGHLHTFLKLRQVEKSLENTVGFVHGNKYLRIRSLEYLHVLRHYMGSLYLANNAVVLNLWRCRSSLEIL